VKNAYRTGGSVYLRPLEEEDAPTLQGWINDPAVTRFLELWRPATREAELDFIRRAGSSDTQIALGIALTADDRVIGAAGLKDIDWKHRRATFGIVIGDPAEWDKGYGTEATRLVTDLAFETLNLNRVQLHVYEYNERGLRTYEKVGYRREGVLRQHHYYGGRYWDVIVMGLLRPEWDEAKRD
jgi:ribosomal-protein-alanine N-acetyltransferase